MSEIVVGENEGLSGSGEPAGNWVEVIRDWYEGLTAREAEEVFVGPFRLMTPAEKAQFAEELTLEGTL